MTHLVQPPEVADTEWLQRTQQAQLATRDQFTVFCDFQFQDRRAVSGIDFQPQIVDEQRWRLQVNHYDHGNGVCVADVDGDRLLRSLLCQPGRKLTHSGGIWGKVVLKISPSSQGWEYPTGLV